MKSFLNEREVIDVAFRKNNCYFHEGGGSVFTDYKNLRGRYFATIAEENKTLTLFKYFGQSESYEQAVSNALNLTTSQGLQRAIEMVTTWWKIPIP